MRKFKQITGLASALLFSTSLGANAVPVADIPPLPTTTALDTPLLAAWTQFGGQPNGETISSKITQIRFITLANAQKCSDVIAREPNNYSSEKPGTFRATMGGKFPINRGQPHQREDEVKFTANICVVDVPEDWAQIELVSKSVTGTASKLKIYPDIDPAPFRGPAAKSPNAEITGVLVADTGCRGDDRAQRGRFRQKCDIGNWPFKPMMDEAAKKKPDFVMHIGDYHYFYELEDSFWSQDNGQDRVEYWLQEFFLPAQKLLLTAPWVMARGNHEKCDHNRWFGEGWYKLFSNVALKPPSFDGSGHLTDNGTPCPVGYDPSVKKHPTAPTWAVDFSSPAQPNVDPWRFVVVDSNDPKNAGQGLLDAAALTTTIKNRNAFWISHYPALKMVYYESRPDFGDWSATKEYQSAMEQCDAGSVFNCRPRVIFSGHQHLYQDIQWTDAIVAKQLPRMIITGHGGTGIDKNGLEHHDGFFSKTPFVCKQGFDHRSSSHFGMGHQGLLTTASQFGYLVIKRNPNALNNQGWDIEKVWNGPAPKFPALSDKQCDGRKLN